jgi:hypothetical protein
MLTFLLCAAAMVVVWRWPQTPVGRALRSLMVDWPADKLAKLDPRKALPKLTAGKILFVILLFLAIAAAIALARTEAVVLLQGVPEGVAWFATFDIATYLDVIAVALVLGATVRLRAIYAAIKAWTMRSALGRLAVGLRPSQGARSRSRRDARRPQPPSNDDEPAWPTLGLAYG